MQAAKRELFEEVVPYIGTWIETWVQYFAIASTKVVPYIGTWIETFEFAYSCRVLVVPYIGTWIETENHLLIDSLTESYLI